MLTNIGFSIVIGHVLGTSLAVRKVRKHPAPDDVKQILTKIQNSLAEAGG